MESKDTGDSDIRRLASPEESSSDGFNVNAKNGNRAMFPVLFFFLGNIARDGVGRGPE